LLLFFVEADRTATTQFVVSLKIEKVSKPKTDKPKKGG